MTTRNPVPGGIDPTRPNVARIYDYLLVGKDNFGVDRETAKQLIATSPDMAGVRPAGQPRSLCGDVGRKP
jgi:hypothetical protein